MTLDRNHPTRGPTPEQLAAYYDGALQGPDRAALEAWLAEHAQADQETAHRLDELFRSTTAPDPAPQAWAGMVDRIAAGRIPAPQAPAVPRRRLLVPLVVGLGAAAAALLLFVLMRSSSDLPAPSMEPLPVVSGNDVVIVKINGDDMALVGATMPIDEISPLAAHGEIEVLEPQDDPAALMQVQGAAPMLIDPRASLARGP
jgi:hypothetical protein